MNLPLDPRPGTENSGNNKLSPSEIPVPPLFILRAYLKGNSSSKNEPITLGEYFLGN